MTKPKHETREDRIAKRRALIEESNVDPAELAAERRLRGEKRPKTPDEMDPAEMRAYLAERK